MVDKVKYEEYIECLLNIARLTNKENSVLINFNVEGDTCSNVVSFIQQDGTKDILKDSVFVCDDEFYKDFLEKLVSEYCKTMVIAFNDSIDMNKDGKYTYRLITEDNDMMSVDGISYDYAKYLMSLTKRKNNVEEDDVDSDISDNEDGVTTAVASFILVMGIGLSFLVMALLLS